MIKCAHCDGAVQQAQGAINRALRSGKPIYCGRMCAGLARRKWKTLEQKREEKAIYDMLYRAKNQDALKAKKAAWHQRSYDPEKAAVARQKTMRRHVEYCRQPEYKSYKREYDKVYRAKQDAGDFWESQILLVNLEKEIAARATRTEIYTTNQTLNKKQERRRNYDRQIGQKPHGYQP